MSGNNNDETNFPGQGPDEADTSGAASRLDQGAAASGRASLPPAAAAGGYRGDEEDYDSDDDSVEPMRPWVADAEFKAMRMEDRTPALQQSSGLMGQPKPFGSQLQRAENPKVRMPDDSYVKPVIRRNKWIHPVLVQVPMYHKVDPYHIELQCNSGRDLVKILDTLRDIFRRESVQANCFANPIKAALLSMDNNELQLSVWQSPADKHKVIVEIQRCRGDLMHCIRKSEAILDALKHEMATGAQSQPSQSTAPFDLHPDGLEKIEQLLNKANVPRKQPTSPSASPRSSQDDISVAPLEMVSTLFRSDRWDSRRLGLESLQIMSDPRRSDLATVIETGYAILHGDQGRVQNESYKLIHDVVFRIVLQRKFKQDDPREPSSAEIDSMEVDAEERVNFLSDDEDEDVDMADPNAAGWVEAPGKTWQRRSDYDEYMSGLFHIALATLTNAVSVVISFCGHSGGGQDMLRYEAAGSIAELVMRRASDMVAESDEFSKGEEASDSLIEVMLRCIRRSHNKQPNATLACVCLRYLCKASPAVRGRIVSIASSQEHIRKAIKVGRECHQQLHAESYALYSSLYGQG